MRNRIIGAAVAVAVMAIAVYAAVRIYSGPGEGALTLRLQAEQVGDAGRLALHFINDGPGNIVLATGQLQTLLVPAKDEPGLVCLYMGRTQEDTVEGRRVVISPYDLKPTEIRAGEEIRFNDISPLLNALPAGKIRLVAAYEIARGIGERYGVWSGYAESNQFELNVNRPASPAAGEAVPEPPPQP